MAFEKMGTFSFNHINQPDELNLPADDTKAKFDSRANELKIALNKVVDLLNATTDGASGADNVGMTPISGLGAASNVQAVVEALITRLNATTDGASGADLIGATGVTGLTGATAQDLIEALKSYVDAHKTDYTQHLTTGTQTISGVKSFSNKIIAPASNIGYGFNYGFIIGFPNGISNQKCDLYFTGIFAGWIEVTLSGTWNNGNSSGKLTKRFSVLTDGASVIWQETKFSTVHGNTKDYFTISDITWDSANNRFRIQIVNLGSYGNSVTVNICGEYVQGDIDTIGIGEIYTTDTTVFPTPRLDLNLSSAWNNQHLTLGNYCIWVDSSGRLRIKNGVPTSDTDGTIVGTQS